MWHLCPVLSSQFQCYFIQSVVSWKTIIDFTRLPWSPGWPGAPVDPVSPFMKQEQVCYTTKCVRVILIYSITRNIDERNLRKKREWYLWAWWTSCSWWSPKAYQTLEWKQTYNQPTNSKSVFSIKNYNRVSWFRCILNKNHTSRPIKPDGPVFPINPFWPWRIDNYYSNLYTLK